jgi:FlaA1/EpsC-like NDP-sugar epimerase
MKLGFKHLLASSPIKRTLFFLFSDILLITASLYLSFLLRFDFSLVSGISIMIIKALPVFIAVKVIAFIGFRLYKITWKYVGINDLCNIVNAIVVSNSVLMILILTPPIFETELPFQLTAFPRSIFLMDGILSICFLSALRISKRLVSEIVLKQRYGKQGKITVIVGAGNTGEMILRDMVKQGFSDFYPAALLDDDRAKIGAYMHGVKVFGTTGELRKAVAEFSAEAVIIAIPSLNYKTLRNIHSVAKDCRVTTIKIVPRIYDYHKPDVNLKGLEEIRVEDLIGRQSVTVDYEEIKKFLGDKVILVTGAGGSIGSEIVLQACAFHPRKVVLFDIDETALHNMQLRLKRSFPHLFDRLHFIAGNIRDEHRVEEIMEMFAPEIIFHAAAYKHVPMMECNPKEAVKVNMFGTHILAKAAAGHGVKKFIMISTDKAVRPTSIMGATKRMAENICKAFNNKDGTGFVSVRFGNVLGSRGSVLPLFLDQLKYGGPLTVTHKDMKRYFMTIPEAVSLVMQASVIGNGGEVLVLDMGEPVRIVALAEELIRIHGLEPYKDIDIEFVGLRPGEKLFEEILTAEEGTVASRHEKIYIAKGSIIYSIEEIEQVLSRMRRLFLNTSPEDEREIRDMLKEYVVHYEIQCRD